MEIPLSVKVELGPRVPVPFSWKLKVTVFACVVIANAMQAPAIII